MTKIIALSAYSGTGKNTLALELENVISSSFMLNVSSYALAEPGKAAVANIFNTEITALEDRDWRVQSLFKSSIGIHSPIDLVRIVLETVAANGFPTIWADALMHKIAYDYAHDDLDFAIVTDLRRTRELRVLREQSTFPVYHFHLTRSIELTDHHNHASESEIEKLGKLADRTFNLDKLDNTQIIKSIFKEVGLENLYDM